MFGGGALILLTIILIINGIVHQKDVRESIQYVKELQKDGYSIVAVTNKGYCLSDENDIISIAGIKPFLICDFLWSFCFHRPNY